MRIPIYKIQVYILGEDRDYLITEAPLETIDTLVKFSNKEGLERNSCISGFALVSNNCTSNYLWNVIQKVEKIIWVQNDNLNHNKVLKGVRLYKKCSTKTEYLNEEKERLEFVLKNSQGNIGILLNPKAFLDKRWYPQSASFEKEVGLEESKHRSMEICIDKETIIEYFNKLMKKNVKFIAIAENQDFVEGFINETDIKEFENINLEYKLHQ